MDHSGNVQTDNLKKNLEEQLDRLVEQLEDLENYKNDMDEEEYIETKKETNEQLQEFNESLEKLVKGNISLVSALSATTQLAISNAFKTPEIIRMFAKQEPKLLREKLKQIADDVQVKKTAKDTFDRQKLSGNLLNSLLPTYNGDFSKAVVLCAAILSWLLEQAEILSALRHLGEQLSREELQFLELHNDVANAFQNIEFIEVHDEA